MTFFQHLVISHVAKRSHVHYLQLTDGALHSSDLSIHHQHRLNQHRLITMPFMASYL